MPFTQEEIEAHLEKLEGWELEEGRWIVRKYNFSSFMKGIAFVDEVAAISEAFNHHPFITIDYKTVTLRLTSWDDGGIMAVDIKEAQQYNEAFEKMRSSH
ncbi:4a-hydroxytetrahydrobiopterin dehydratase [Paenibacillus sp. SEL3]|jgi:4a-hydroxytetrahydrobiopterin dehydratase|uniref:4a-hydroxytetrahydrobiopterin dehydratase n=8 Tax=Paenibacillus TaxID=44249 RepID=E3EEW9_PAEPS|nr:MULTISPECIES: 4a-hydroxytetrahydrobiopterin dehydratase [Paenibacillus]KAF6625445.1 4a-hydroxytetrahydrobiopterin dehydratase [Paenibacillus sp. EKM208P]MBE0340552.1 4a-hydroxytetrahydrobiopterin dehydratase [Paenibacillus sp. 28ISP30-2]MCF2716768.1 4a-hydroxytetrahydrobiopterin dehydratase [Paenibacillus sp. UKAQ_18]MCV9952439.1 4a-hydroxytetrahydrobiopterin dehydratase [Paenibacillus sp. BT-177]ADM68002.1 pterin-4-alpha-carbinolamine dehydratase [Paenibacillus polymyxa E681]